MKNKFINRIIILLLIVLGIIFGLNNKCLAENNTNESDNAHGTSQNESSKSSNANLNNLGIRPYDFTGFRYGTTTYNVTVPKNTQTIEVYAEAQDSKAKVSGTGTKTLENNKTSVDIVVTAEDGTKKTYTINITKGEITEENTTNKTNITNKDAEIKSNGLSSLKINELNLTPDFKTNVYEYSVKYIGEDTKLDIKAEATSSDYIVEIVGNKDLKEGENVITILVSDKNTENVATYQITVNKSLTDENAQNSENKQNNLIIAGTIGAILFISIIVFLVKRKKNKEYDYDEEKFKENEFNKNEESKNEFKEEKEDDEEELPRALRNKHKFESKYDYEEITKEDARKNFLDGYNNNDDYKEEKKQSKHRGKRFK